MPVRIPKSKQNPSKKCCASCRHSYKRLNDNEGIVLNCMWHKKEVKSTERCDHYSQKPEK